MKSRDEDLALAQELQDLIESNVDLHGEETAFALSCEQLELEEEEGLELLLLLESLDGDNDDEEDEE